MSVVRDRRDDPPSLARATSSMAAGTLVSRLTGFVSRVLLTAVLSFGVISDSYIAANTLPNIIFELLIGGVLTSVVVPLLVRANREDADGGAEYTQRLVTIAAVMLLAATAVTVVGAPLLAQLLLGDGQSANVPLATAFAYLLLPQIVFYGLAALFGAILHSRNVFVPYAWAPVLNNLVVIATLGVYTLVPGEISLDPMRMGSAKLLVLGVGTTLGIVTQALVLVPALWRVGFRFRWRWGWDPRLAQAGRLLAWVVGYVAVSQVGLIVTFRAAAEGVAGSVVIYQYAWMLFQLPYGVLGVSLLTAILPRMSAAAAEGDYRGVVDNLSVGARYSVVLLAPIAAAMTVAGESLGVALFSFGEADVADAGRLGLAVAFSAFGLLPFAVTMLQLRVFYAMADARTPTMIMIVMTAVKVPLLLACPVLLGDRTIVLGLAFVNALSFLVGAVVGQVWLRLRLGRVQTLAILATTGKTALAALPAVAAALAVRGQLDTAGPAGAWLELVVSAVVVVAVMGVALTVLRTSELAPALRPLLARLAPHLRGRQPDRDAPAAPTASEGRERAARGEQLVADPEQPVASEPARVSLTDVSTQSHPRSAAGGGTPPGSWLTPGVILGRGRYRLFEEVGVDARCAARLWRGRDLVLDRDVALTLFVADAGDDSATADLGAATRRALRGARMESSGAARVLDVLEPERGPGPTIAAVVAEWTPGRDLVGIVRDGLPEPSEAARMLAPLAGAVDDAHRAGFVLGCDHPSRIRVDANGHARLAFPGPPAATEPRDDVRGVGAALYLLLTGRWPLPGGPDELPVAPRGPEGGVATPRSLRSVVPAELSALAWRSVGGADASGLRSGAAMQRMLQGTDPDDDQPAADDDPGPRTSLWRVGDTEPASPPARTRKRRLVMAALLAACLLVLGWLGYQVLAIFTGWGTDTPVVVGAESDGRQGQQVGPAAAGAGPVPITSYAVYDPSGIDADNAEQVDRVGDGQPGTMWSTDVYVEQFPSFKPGLGVVLDLARPVTPQTVTVQSPSAGTVVEIRAASSPQAPLSQTTLLSTATLSGGSSTIPLPDATRTDYLVVWITKMAPGGDGFQSALAEITVRGG